MKRNILNTILACAGLLFCLNAKAMELSLNGQWEYKSNVKVQSVNKVLKGEQGRIISYVTEPDGNFLLSEMDNITFRDKHSGKSAPIIVDPGQKYQTMEGFGFALTGGSAQMMIQMSPQARHELIEELFGKGEGQAGISCIRLSLGSSDLNSFVFSYDDMPEGKEDWTLSQFSLSQDLNDVVPVMKEILAVNPDIFIISSPWSAPTWMKESRDVRGGKLRRECYEVYADYFVKYIKAMAAQGIHIDAVTVQNEPLNNRNTPSMPWDPQDQLDFIADYLGPAIKAGGIDTDIILFDHNCDRIDYPLAILADPRISEYVCGTGFHHYMGDLSAMAQMHLARPDKDIYFTEQMLIDRSFSKSGKIAASVKRVVIDVTRAWSRNIVLWNLASDRNAGPHTDNGGCPFCYGAVSIEGDEVDRNLAFYTVSHISSFVPRGSVRIYSTDVDDPAIMTCNDEQHPEVVRANYYSKSSVLPNVAFSTPEGKTVLIVANTTSSDQTVEIQYKGKYADVFLKSGAVGTYIW